MNLKLNFNGVFPNNFCILNEIMLLVWLLLIFWHFIAAAGFRDQLGQTTIISLRPPRPFGVYHCLLQYHQFKVNKKERRNLILIGILFIYFYSFKIKFSFVSQINFKATGYQILISMTNTAFADGKAFISIINDKSSVHYYYFN